MISRVLCAVCAIVGAVFVLCFGLIAIYIAALVGAVLGIVKIARAILRLPKGRA